MRIFRDIPHVWGHVVLVSGISFLGYGHYLDSDIINIALYFLDIAVSGKPFRNASHGTTIFSSNKQTIRIPLLPENLTIGTYVCKRKEMVYHSKLPYTSSNTKPLSI